MWPAGSGHMRTNHVGTPGLAQFLAQTPAHEGGQPLTAPPAQGLPEDPVIPPAAGQAKAPASAALPKPMPPSEALQRAVLADVQRQAQASRAILPGLSYFLR
jgi:hypothetical protein